jgi:hypothetical protein
MAISQTPDAIDETIVFLLLSSCTEYHHPGLMGSLSFTLLKPQV